MDYFLNALPKTGTFSVVDWCNHNKIGIKCTKHHCYVEREHDTQKLVTILRDPVDMFISACRFIHMSVDKALVSDHMFFKCVWEQTYFKCWEPDIVLDFECLQEQWSMFIENVVGVKNVCTKLPHLNRSKMVLDVTDMQLEQIQEHTAVNRLFYDRMMNDPTKRVDKKTPTVT